MPGSDSKVGQGAGFSRLAIFFGSKTNFKIFQKLLPKPRGASPFLKSSPVPRRKAEAVVAALSMSVLAEAEHACSELLDHPDSIYRACADMKLFNQEVLRVRNSLMLP